MRSASPGDTSLHVCFVAPAAWPILSQDRASTFTGGAEVQQCLIARTLVRRGYRVSMICADHGQPETVEIDGITVVRCPRSGQGGVPGLRFFHPWLSGLWTALSRVDADVYYQRTASVLTGIVAAFARIKGRRFVFAAACDFDLARNETWRLFQRRAGWRDRHVFQIGVRLADTVVVQHQGQAADCERWYGRPAVKVPSCYEASPERGAAADGVVLWVSTIRPIKRPELFVELARRLPAHRFRMVGGPGPEPGARELFERVKREASTLPNLEFVGFVPHAEVEPQFDKARVLVNTSEREGFPNTFLQAWSRGIPTVGFCDTGSTADGHIVGSVETSLDAMSARVRALMTDDAAWLDAGRHARRYVEQAHSVDAALSAYEHIFATTSRPAILRGATVPTT